MSPDDKPLVWLAEVIKTPPLSHPARIDHVDPEAVVILHVFAKKTRKTPAAVIDLCRKRLEGYKA